jgi:hypothetical protein
MTLIDDITLTCNNMKPGAPTFPRTRPVKVKNRFLFEIFPGQIKCGNFPD